MIRSAASFAGLLFCLQTFVLRYASDERQFFQIPADIPVQADRSGFYGQGAHRFTAVHAGVNGFRILLGHRPERILDDDRGVRTDAKLQKQDMLPLVRLQKSCIVCRS